MSAVTGFRISPQQAAAWRQQQAPGAPRYGSVLQIALEGTLDTEQSFQRLAQLSSSEEILRTRFEALPGMALPIQSIAEETLISFALEDLRGLSSDDQEQKLRQWRSLSDVQAPLSVILARRTDHHYVLTLRAPACYADSQSLRLIAEALLTDASQEERLQYADYAEWKNRLIEDDPSHPGVLYWKQQQAQAARTLTPGMECATRTGVFRPAAQELFLEEARAAALANRAARLGCALDEFLLAAWLVLLARLSGQETLPIACTESGRGNGLDTAIGLYAQTLPVYASVDLARPLSTQIEEILAPYRHGLVWRDYYDSSAHLEYGFVFREALALKVPLSAALLYEDSLDQRYTLRLECARAQGGLLCRLAYDRDALCDESVACIVEQWRLLLDGLLQDADLPPGRIALLGEVQRRILMPSSPEPEIEPVSIVRLFERQVARTPSAPALVDTTSTLRYDELNRRANQLARYLKQAGARPGDVVGILLPRGNDAIVAILGALKAGMAYLPLDPNYPAQRLSYMVEDSSARYIVTVSALADLLPASPALLCLDRIEHELAGLAADDLAFSPAPEQIAYLIYTSGSTGQPKAVEITHRGLSHSTQVRMAYYKTPVRAYLLLSSLAFDSSVAGIFWTLVQGGLLVLPGSGEEMALEQLVQMIQEHRVSHSLSLPSLYDALLSFAAPEQLESLDTWIVAGEACRETVVARHAERLPQVRLVNEYGPTEATVWATADTLDAESITLGVSIGKPIPTMRLWLLNQWGALAALGEPGEIYLGGPTLACGYRGKPEQTAKAFLQHQGIPGEERVYRTGDLARWRIDGRLAFLGRRDRQVKIRGYRVELDEIERQLQTHPAVHESVVVAQESADSTRLVAYLTCAPGQTADIEALQGYLTARLPAHMVPGAFVLLKSFPRTPNGKLDIQALPEPDKAATSRPPYVAPRNELESKLAQICAEVLRLPMVGAFDNFFQIGGDSILSLQVVARASQHGIRLSARQIFERQTVAAMAEVAEWQQAPRFSLDVHWRQIADDRQALEAFELAATRYHAEPIEVCAAVLYRSFPDAVSSLKLAWVQQGGEANTVAPRYTTEHELRGAAPGWTETLQVAKTALRQIANFEGETPDVALELRPLPQDTGPNAPAFPMVAPLYLSVSLEAERLALLWSADQSRYPTERLRVLAERFLGQLRDLSAHCSAVQETKISALDFPSAGLDEEALEGALAELAAADDLE